MEEKELKPEEKNDTTQLTWEAPRLYALDKGKTESGDYPNTYEDVFNHS